MSDDEGYRLTRYRGKWCLTTGVGADRRRRSTGSDDLARAEKIARRMWKALSTPASDRMADLWDAYIMDRKGEGKNVSRQETAWLRLNPHFGEKLGDTISKEDCKLYTAARRRIGASASTVKTELDYLRAAINLRYGKGNNKVWTPRPSVPRDRYLSQEEATKLLDNIETPHVKLFVILALTTGARMSAILEMKWGQIDFKHKLINLNPEGREETGNKRRALVPMNSRAEKALLEAAAGALTDWVIEYKRLPVASVKKAVRGAAARSKVPCSPHVFRHTAGVWMAQRDVPMQKISQYLGHTSTRVTESVYARYSPSFMRDAAAALDW